MYIVLYNPGAGGHMVSSMIDNKDYFSIVSLIDNTIMHMYANDNTPRLQLRTIDYHEDYICLTPEEREQVKIECLSKCNEKYLSVADSYVPHYIDMDKTHLKLKQYDYIVIDDTEFIEHTTKRNLEVDFNMSGVLKFHKDRKVNIDPRRLNWLRWARTSTVMNKIIQFEDIINGNLIDILKQWVDTPLDEELYGLWVEKYSMYNRKGGQDA